MNNFDLTVPILSRGKHRNPRKGACFMEFASYLAGERWSDHPACTQGTLAHLARMVNDRTSDTGRGRLAPLVPQVIGLTSDDPLLDVIIAVRASEAALPIAAESRQRSLSVALHAAIDTLAERRDVFAAEASGRARAALRVVPAADDWASRFIARVAPVRRPGMGVRQCRDIVTDAVQGIAEACVSDAEDRLVELFIAALADAERFVVSERAAEDASASVPVPAASPADATVAS